MISCPGHIWDGSQSSFTGPALDLCGRQQVDPGGAAEHEAPASLQLPGNEDDR